ncbi:MAG: hypothetical protein CSA72_01980 [Rhodobacterales bacterium]|nr:MAG: hypothetical protein CSA72_01980 [Rhodobacterales bacterium]
MEPWILVTLLAAFAQATRFVLQKKMTATGLTPAGATFARFLFAFPVVALLAALYAGISAQALPGIPAQFWPYAMAGGLAQIGGTIATVSLFQQRNFAVGITFKKTEVILAALVGLAVLGEGVSGVAVIAIVLGLAGVLLLSRNPTGGGVFTRAAGIGLLAGLLFAISGVAYRGASLSLTEGNAVLRAAVTLACVTGFQTLAMIAGFLLRDPGQIGAVLRRWKAAALVALTSLVGSLCWFIAFTLQTVALVKAVGQVELVFSLAASWLIFAEKITRRELAGMALVLGSVLLLIAAHP